MSNEQKLREALRELMSIVSIHQKATRNNFAWAEMDFAREALATTGPEPTGMPDRPTLPRCMYPNMQYQRSHIGNVYTADQMQTYGEQCWKAGYKHGKSDTNN